MARLEGRRRLEARLGAPPPTARRSEREVFRRIVVALSVRADLRRAVPLMTDEELARRLDEAVFCAGQSPYWDFYDVDPASRYAMDQVRETLFPDFIVAELLRREMLPPERRAEEETRRRRRRETDPDVAADVEGGRLFVDDLLDRMAEALSACSDWWRRRSSAAD